MRSIKIKQVEKYIKIATSYIKNLSTKQKILHSTYVAIFILIMFYFFGYDNSKMSNILVSPKRGEFIVSITTTGELQAKNSIEIKGPLEARMAQIWQMKISKLVPEGTIVKKGQFIAELDKAEIASKLKEAELSVQKLEAQYTQVILDSTLALSQARDELENMLFAKEEKQIAVEQSTYEAPAVKRQAQIAFERSERNYEQTKKNYLTKIKQSVAKIKSVEADLMKERQKLNVMTDVLKQFTILAPADGMVVYAREWGGKKIVVGSQISSWEPKVATLPDFSLMESITYVNEIDIQKVKVGMPVKIKLDAMPNKLLNGKVGDIANIGEQRPNSDSKVFEVSVLISDRDTTLRPSMTTSNEILISKTPNALFVPLETIRTQDSVSFVYVKSGGSFIKKEVLLGLQNDNEAIVLEGIDEDDKLFLSTPADESKEEIKRLKKSK